MLCGAVRSYFSLLGSILWNSIVFFPSAFPAGLTRPDEMGYRKRYGEVCATLQPYQRPMTKKDLVTQISRDTGLDEDDVYAVVQRALELMMDALARGEPIELRNFGIFRVKWQQPRIGRNPHQPEETVPIPARPAIKFKPGKRLRERVLQLSEEQVLRAQVVHPDGLED